MQGRGCAWQCAKGGSPSPQGYVMTISKIRIANFKSFADQTVELKNFNLLVGANASGKSNFVQAFQFLRDIATHGLEDAISLQGGVEYLRNVKIGDAQPLIFHMVIRDESILTWMPPRLSKPPDISIDRIDTLDYLFSLRFPRGGTGFSVENDRLALTYARRDNGASEKRQDDSVQSTVELKRSDGKLELHTASHETESRELLENSLIPETDLLLESAYASTFMGTGMSLFRNIVIYDIDPKSTKSTIPIAGRPDLKEDASNLAVVLSKLLSNEDSKRDFLNLCHHSLPFIQSLDIGKIADRNIYFRLREEFAEEVDFPAFSISDGTVNIMALVVALYFQEQRKFAIFEEPERNLHPYLLSRVMAMFKEASEFKQILATTHNSEIVKYAGLENILFVARDKNGFSRITKPATSEHVKIFLENDLGVEDLFADNLLGV